MITFYYHDRKFTFQPEECRPYNSFRRRIKTEYGVPEEALLLPRENCAFPLGDNYDAFYYDNDVYVFMDRADYEKTYTLRITAVYRDPDGTRTRTVELTVPGADDGAAVREQLDAIDPDFRNYQFTNWGTHTQRLGGHYFEEPDLVCVLDNRLSLELVWERSRYELDCEVVRKRIGEDQIGWLRRHGYADDLEREFMLTIRKVTYFYSDDDTPIEIPEETIRVRAKGKDSMADVMRIIEGLGVTQPEFPWDEKRYTFRNWPHVETGNAAYSFFTCELNNRDSLILAADEQKISAEVCLYGCPNADTVPGALPECCLTEFEEIVSVLL